MGTKRELIEEIQAQLFKVKMHLDDIKQGQKLKWSEDFLKGKEQTLENILEFVFLLGRTVFNSNRKHKLLEDEYRDKRI